MEQQVMVPQVTLQDAKNYANMWTYRGLAIALSDADYQYATDFANIVLKNFVLQCAAQAEAAMRAHRRPAVVEGEGTLSEPQVSNIQSNVIAGSIVE